MAKKLSFLLAAVAVLAFAVPAMASAAPTLQNSAGELLKTGSTIVGTGSDVTITSETLGPVTCTTITLEGVLSVNDATNGIVGAGENPSPPTTGCVNVENPVNVTNVKLTNLSSTVGGTALASFTAQVDVGSEVCTFTGSNIKGSYTNGGNVLTFSKAGTIKGSPIACGNGTLDGTFTLEQKGGGALKAVF